MTFDQAYEIGFRDGADGKANKPPATMSLALHESYDEGFEAGCVDRKIGDINDKWRANLSEGW